MSKTNIIYKKSLKEYFSRYGKNNHLIKIKKSELGDFNKDNNVRDDNTHYALKGKRWWLIGDTYYEAPSKKKKTAFASLALLLLAGGSVTLGVGQGVYHWFGGGGGDTPTPGPEPGPVPPTPTEKITVTLEAATINNHGYFKDTKNDPIVEKTVEIDKGSKYSDVKNKFPIPLNDDDGWNFAKWYTTDTKTKEIDDSTIFSESTTIHADYSNKFYEEKWEDLASKISAGKTLAELKKEYGIQSFIGQVKPVEYTVSSNETKIYNVRVVGEKTDNVDVGEGDKKLNALTFEFENVLLYNDTGFKFSETEDNKWSNSYLEQTILNGNDGVISRLPSSITNNLVSVNKKTHSGNATDKLFVPSLSEIGITKNPETTATVEEEGETYDYYKNLSDEERAARLKKKTIKEAGETGTKYWLRSNDTNATKINVWGVNAEGLIGEEKAQGSDRRVSYAHDESLGVVPCFCIGQEEPTIQVKFEAGEHGTIEEGKETIKVNKFATWGDIKDSSDIPTVTAAEGYKFVHWAVDKEKVSQEISDTYKFSDELVTLYPYYEKTGSIECLSFTANEASTITPKTDTSSLSKTPNIMFSKNSVETSSFAQWNSNVEISLEKGDILYVYGVNETFNESDTKNISFMTTGNISVAGDAMCLLYKETTNGLEKRDTVPAYGFCELFAGEANDYNNKKDVKTKNPGLTDASGFRISADKIEERGCWRLFGCCTELKTAPTSLTPSNLETYCYGDLFGNCWNLKTAPELLATDVTASSCYIRMFGNCSSLTNVPLLSATKVGNGSYYGMFLHCASLVDAPTLDAETLDESSYCDMFNGCTALVNAPKVLPAETVGVNTYSRMFEGCTSLENGPEFMATTLSEGSTTTSGSFVETFKNCSNIKHVKVHFTTWFNGSYTSTYDWFNGITAPSALSTEYVFECPSDLDVSTRDKHHVLKNWTIVNYAS